MTDYERAAFAIGYLRGLSALLWSIGDGSNGVQLSPEDAGFFDEQVDVLARAVTKGEGDE